MTVDESVQDQAQRSVKRWTTGVIICRLFIAVPLLLGFIGLGIGMTRAFETVGKSDALTPDVLAANIGFALTSSASSMAVASIAVIPLIITKLGLIRARRRLAATKSLQQSPALN